MPDDLTDVFKSVVDPYTFILDSNKFQVHKHNP